MLVVDEPFHQSWAGLLFCVTVRIRFFKHLGQIIEFFIYELRLEIYNNVVCAARKALDQSAHTRSLIRAFASRLNIILV